MTISELKEMLSEIEEQHGDLEVVLAWQPTYPLQAHIEAVTAVDGEVVYLAQGAAPDMPYAPSEAWEGGDVYREDADDEGLLG